MKCAHKNCVADGTSIVVAGFLYQIDLLRSKPMCVIHARELESFLRAKPRQFHMVQVAPKEVSIAKGTEVPISVPRKLPLLGRRQPRKGTPDDPNK